ncbi:MAG: hypothetical protein JOZ75_01075 [Candidatus Dormibacteraeota bacterium]|nr:hypothetical protein [Candidatus Dormibacteraeota bacterium]
MSQSLVDRIVGATLYEGYILYPYRPTSVKNQVRWTFGGVFPRAYAEQSGGTERSTVTTECLLRAGAGARVTVTARFLHPVTRTVLQLSEPVRTLTDADIARATAVASLDAGGRRHVSWEEATERSIDAGTYDVSLLLDAPRAVTVTFPAHTEREPVDGEDGMIAGVVERAWHELDLTVAISAEPRRESVRAIRVEVSNMTDAGGITRESALLHALVSAHVVLIARGATWLSLADPPDDQRDAAAACVNDGLWPVLISEDCVDDTVLASPIILEDHPQVAPESAGDLFDATEIDEILSLRILSLTDEEKDEMRAADARARELLERTEALTEQQFMRMHGTIRELRPASGHRP